MESVLPRIGLIGAGRLASAMCAGWVADDPGRSGAIGATDRYPEQSAALAAAYGVRAVERAADLAAASDVLLVAVKPQDMEIALTEIAPVIAPTTIVCSTAAGVPLGRLRAALPPQTPVARIMPNIPVAVGAGVVAVAGDEAAIVALRPWLDPLGAVVEIDEDLFDAVTAVTGSGPGLLARVIEALADGARDVGFDEDQARDLAVLTFAGTGDYLRATGTEAHTLREQVTSPGGTTAAGLERLEEGAVPAIRAAIVAARDRATALRTGA